LAPLLFAGSIRKSNRGGLCITRQSTRTHKCVRTLASRRALHSLCAGYLYVMPQAAALSFLLPASMQLELRVSCSRSMGRWSVAPKLAP
jgi:hypothetical protein